MSNSFPPDDELISAYLDGEVTEAERAAIEADERSMALVAELRLAQEAVAAPVEPLSDTDREHILAAALAASETSTTVTSMTVARPRRRYGMARVSEWTLRNRRPLIAVAAAALAIALAVPLARNLDLGDDASDLAGTTSDVPAEEAAEEPAAELAAEAASADDAGAAAIAAAPTTAFEAAEEPAEEAAEEPAEEAAEEPAEEAAEEPAEEAADEDTGGDGIEFAPLGLDLGEFESAALAVEQVFVEYELWREDPAASALRAGDEATSPPPTCLADLLGDSRFEELYRQRASDIAVASIAGKQHEIWLFEDGTVYVAASESCHLVLETNYFEG